MSVDIQDMLVFKSLNFAY